jgi:integrase
MWQQLLYRRPLPIVQPKKLRHRSSPPEELEANPPWSTQWVRSLGRFILERQSEISANTLFHNLRMLAMIMRCLVPTQDWKWIARHPAGPHAAVAATARQMPRIFEPGVLTHRLSAELAALDGAPITVETTRRDLLIVDVALFTSLRVETLTGIRLGRHLVRRPSGWELHFEEDDTKTETALIRRVPKIFERDFGHYLEHDRPLLLSRSSVDTDVLWLSHLGRAMHVNSIRQIFLKITDELYAERLNPHCVRHTSATTLIAHDPTSVETAAAGLGHKGVRSVDQHYDLTGTSIAQSAWLNLTKRYGGDGTDG